MTDSKISTGNVMTAILFGDRKGITAEEKQVADRANRLVLGAIGATAAALAVETALGAVPFTAAVQGGALVWGVDEIVRGTAAEVSPSY